MESVFTCVNKLMFPQVTVQTAPTHRTLAAKSHMHELESECVHGRFQILDSCGLRGINELSEAVAPCSGGEDAPIGANSETDDVCHTRGVRTWWSQGMGRREVT
jgi:hypothetical protein